MMLKLKEIAKKLWVSPTATTWLNNFVRVLKSVCVIPLVVTLLSTDEISAYYIFNTFLAISLIFTQSLSTTYTRAFSYAWAGASSFSEVRDTENIPNKTFFNESYTISLVLQKHVTFIIIALNVCFGSVVLFNKYSFSLANCRDIWLSWLCILLTIGCAIWNSRNQSVLRGVNQVARMNRWSALFDFIPIALMVLALTFGFGLVGCSFAILIGAVVALFRSHILVHTSPAKFLLEENKSYKKTTYKDILSSTYKHAAMAASARGVNYSAGLIATFFIAEQDLASYLQAISFIILVNTFSLAPFSSKVPMFNMLRAKGDLKELADKAGRAMKISLLVFGVMCCMIPPVVQVLYEVIDSNVSFVSWEIWLSLAIVWFLERHQGNHASLVITTNKIPFVSHQVITGLAKLLLMLILGKYWGVFGIIAAHGLSNLICMNWITTYLAVKSLSVNYKSCLSRYVLSAISIFIFMILWIPNSYRISEIIISEF